MTRKLRFDWHWLQVGALRTFSCADRPEGIPLWRMRPKVGALQGGFCADADGSREQASAGPRVLTTHAASTMCSCFPFLVHPHTFIFPVQ